MKIHWMENHYILSPAEIKNFSNTWEDAGYSSVLLTFNSASPDNWIKSAAAVTPGQKIKYMIAIRPYHLSPQYCAMMIEGFNSIDPNRLIINFVAGDVQNRPEEPAQKDVFGNTKPLETINDRKIFVRNFVEELKQSSVIKHMPEFVFSGYSPYTIETAEVNDGISLSMWDDYLKNIDLFKNVNRVMVSAGIFLRDSEKLAQEEFQSIIDRTRELDYTICGDQDTLLQTLKKMKKDGITDVLIHKNMKDNESWRIHETIKNLKEEIYQI